MTAPDRRQLLHASAGSAAALFLAPSFELLHPRFAGAPLAIAVIGAGRQGRAILGELATIPEASVVAVCDTDDSRLQSAVRRAQGLKGYATHTELLEKEPGITAVVIATPTHLHKEIALSCIAAGKHVFCEAPLAHTVDDTRAIVAAAKGSSKTFAVGFQGRANPVYSLARSFFKAGTLRSLSHLRAQDHKKTSWRTPGSTPERDRELNWHLDGALSLGLAGEKGSHQLDVFHHFLGKFPVSVRGAGETRLYNDGRTVADTILCEARFEDGLRASYSATLCNSYEGRYELIGGEMALIKLGWTHGWMFKEADAPTQGWEVYANRQQYHNDSGITLIADATKLAAQGKLTEGVGLPHSALWYGLESFLKAVAGGTPVAVGADEGFRNQVIAAAGAKALATGEAVAITDEMLKAI